MNLTKNQRKKYVFFSQLHHLEIHFRSLHMGNIVLTNERILGLIDTSDMSIYTWLLMINTRKHSFKHIYRYQDDIKSFGKVCWELLLEGYANNSKLTKSKIENINLCVSEYSSKCFKFLDE